MNASVSKIYDEAGVFAEIDQLIDDGGYDNALKAYKLIEELDGSTKVERFEWLKAAGDAAFTISNYVDDREQCLIWLRKARDYAKKAREMDAKDSDALRLLCATMGRLAEQSSIREKMTSACEFQSLLNEGIAMDPSKYEYLHMRGRFRYEVCMLGFFERTAARALGILPSVTLDDALSDLMAAQSSESNMAENMICIAKVFEAKKDLNQAKQWLKKAAEMDEKKSDPLQVDFIMEARGLLLDKEFK